MLFFDLDPYTAIYSKVTTMPTDQLVLPSPELRKAIDYICQSDRDFLKIELEAGALTVGRRSPDFASLVRIILGQQLSSKAAQAIFLRLNNLIELTPAQFINCSEITLKEVGLSQTKIATCQRLATTILAGQLSLDALPQLPDALIVEKLTQIKGIGVWTAEIYLLFCLERLSIFPASDLAIQISYQKLKALANRPTRSELMTLTQNLEPYRGAAAHLLWHYYTYSKNHGG